MDDFESRLVQVLKTRPGLTKQRLAEALGVECNDEFWEKLGQACDRGVVHKVQDKYYPGNLKSY
jgi:hypothetical protein